MRIDIPYTETTEPIGPGLIKILEAAYGACVHENDHFPLLLLGPTNSGKSNLGLWIYEKLHPTPDVHHVVWTRDEFAKMQAVVAKEPMPRILMYDELDAESKAAMSRWNREFKRLFDKVRYSNIFWLLVNPSARYIDRSLIEDEVVKAVIVIRDKSKTKPRRVAVYLLRDLIRMLNKDVKLTLDNLRSKKVIRKYAFGTSWFKKYDGVLAVEYDKKKEARTLDIHDMFAKENAEAGKTVSLQKLAKDLRVGQDRVRPIAHDLAEQGLIRGKTLGGRWMLNEEEVKLMTEETYRRARVTGGVNGG